MRVLRLVVVISIVTMIFFSNALADGKIQKAGEKTEEQSFLGNFSVGLAVFHLPDSEIKKAEVVNGVVRVTDEQDARIGPWLQTTYVWDGLGTTWTHPGFFLGVEIAGDDGLFRTFGAGFQISFRRSVFDPVKNHSVVGRNLVNVGIGAYVSKIQVLADGISENQSLPESYESIVLRDKTVYGPMLSISFTF